MEGANEKSSQLIKDEQSGRGRYPTLETSIQVDIGVIGSGLTAIQTALDLFKSGARVALVAPGDLIEGELRAEFLHPAEPSNYSHWQQALGLEKGLQVAEIYRAAMADLQAKAQTIPQSHAEPTPTFTVAEHLEDLLAIERECAIGRAFHGDCWFVRDVELPFRCAGASRDNQQCKLQLTHLLRALISEFQMLGGELYEHSPTIAPPKLGRVCRIATEHGQISCANVVFAGRLPQANLLPATSQMTPLHSYMMSARADRTVGDAIYVIGGQPRRMIWRSDRSDASRLIVRADYYGSQAESQTLRLEELSCYGASRFSLKRVDHRWSAHRLVAADGAPVVGRIPGFDNVFVAMGMGLSEMPWGLTCGSLLAKMIRGDTSPFEAVCDPARLSATARAPHPMEPGGSGRTRLDSGAGLTPTFAHQSNGASALRVVPCAGPQSSAMKTPFLQRHRYDAEAWRSYDW
jgi:glycine/D-amino acid oxidase-like deaminating enzyme